ncbi:hypothetical protein [Paenarthrobacter sp. YIM B13468]|uniref:hypothetical protein n=1 Tax=Paenarthrobacter sp. YIM B13468 TaxID=3366295 RepID=UPI003671A8E8
MTKIAAERTEVCVLHAHDLDQALEHEVGRLQIQACAQGAMGILVTRLAPGRFTIELSPLVPYGYTYEKTLETATPIGKA